MAGFWFLDCSGARSQPPGGSRVSRPFQQVDRNVGDGWGAAWRPGTGPSLS
jgi:hypothetical protein